MHALIVALGVIKIQQLTARLTELNKRLSDHEIEMEETESDKIQLTTLSTDKLAINIGHLISNNSHPIQGQTRVDVQDQLVLKPP